MDREAQQKQSNIQAARQLQDLRTLRKEALLEPPTRPTSTVKTTPPSDGYDAVEALRAGRVAVSSQVSTPKPWWQSAWETTTTFVQNKIVQPIQQVVKPVLDRAPALRRIAAQTIVTAMVTTGAVTTYQWVNNVLTKPDVFSAAKQNTQAQYDQLIRQYPDLQADRETKQKNLLTHPYQALSAGLASFNAFTGSMAGFADAVWQQNPRVQQAAGTWRQAGDQYCPGISSQAWMRRCTAFFYGGASLIDQPVDSTLGLANTMIVYPVEGLVKDLALSVEYNPVRTAGDFIQGWQKNGWQGILDVIQQRVDLTMDLWANDPQFQSFAVMAGILLILGGASLAGVPALIIKGAIALAAGGQTIWGGVQLDRAIQQARDLTDVKKIAGSHEARTFVVTSLLILALTTGVFAKGLGDFQSFQASLSPAAQENLAGLSWLDQLKLFDVALSLKASPGAVEFYLQETARSDASLAKLPLTTGLRFANTYTQLKPEAQLPIQKLPFESQVKIFGLGERPIPDPTHPVLNLNPQEVKVLTEISTMYPDAKYAVVGAWKEGLGYTTVGEGLQTTYLNMPEVLYENFYKNYPADFRFVINKQFLDNIAKQNKPVILETPYKVLEGKPDSGAYWEVFTILENEYKYSLQTEPGPIGYNLLIPPK